jgi:type IV pilus assembly protein PilF
MPDLLFKLVAGVIAALLMSACVTTQTGGFEDKKDPKKAVEYSVQAARNYIQEGNWEAAKRHLKTALSIDSHSAEANEALALVFWRTGEYEQADKHFRTAADYASDNEGSRIRNNYAAFLYDRKRYADAETQLEKVAEDLLYDGRRDAFLNLGKVRIKLKKYTAAKDVLERAILMDRGNPMVMFPLAEVYVELGDYAKAQVFYDAYRKQNPAPSAASLWLGIRLAEHAGDKDAAASYALALKNLFPLSEEYLAYKSVNSNAGIEH